MGLGFIFNSILLGIGLSMDAFSISLANGLKEKGDGKKMSTIIGAVFGGFQFLMPLIGWVCVTLIVDIFTSLTTYIPWIALILLSAIGALMIRDGITGEEEEVHTTTDLKTLFLQGFATSMDALSVGFTIASYDFYEALVSTVVIGLVTFIICVAGYHVGKKFGMKLADKTTILGGTILILIGLEIFFNA